MIKLRENKFGNPNYINKHMSFKSENWKEILEQVRTGLKEQPIVEKTDDELLSDEIDSLLEGFTEEVVEASPEEVLSALEEIVAEDQSIQTIQKLTEKNMLGRLAKSMELTEDNKQKLFDYFDKGELEQ